MKTIKTVSALLALLLATPAIAQTPAPAPAAPTIPADPALWVVKDTDTTIDSAVRKAFDASGQLVLEIPLPSPEQAKAVIGPLAVDATGKPLTQKLSAEDRKVYATAMAKLGIPETAFDTFEPWFAAVTLAQIELQKSGFNAAEGVEVALNAAAKASGKPVAGLETLEQQLGYFHNLPQTDQIAFLISSAKDIDTFDSTINAMLDRWKAGDAEGLSKLMNDDLTSQPNLYKVLLADRNARWADWIDTRLKTPGTVFIAVGAGHLAGKDSVQVYLTKHHLVAKRVRY
jgi:uncharacterized protein YbaP (TraB family)